MKGVNHKIFGIIIFITLFSLNILPVRISSFLQQGWINIIMCLVIVFLFTGGRITNKKWYSFGLSPDNDFHKKGERSWLIHSPIIPMILILVFNNPLILIACFAYSMHLLLDLFNPRSWEGSKYTYVIIFFSTTLFFVIMYK